MDWLQEHWFKAGILLAVLLFAASPAYYFVYYLPQKDAARENALAVEQLRLDLDKSEQAYNLQVCLERADMNATAMWSANCKLEGKAANCDSLLMYHVEAVNEARDQDKANCFKQYPPL